MESKAKSRQPVMPDENNVPYLGLCLGMQLMVVEFARHVFHNEEANSTEFDRTTALPGDRPDAGTAKHHGYGRNHAPGSIPCASVARHESCGCVQRASVQERHRHRFEFNNAYREELRRKRDGFLRSLPGWPAGGNCRAAGPSFHARHPIPSRISLPPQPPPSAFHGIYEGGL